MFERFTKRARTVVVHAQEIARERRSPTIGSEHLLLGLFAVPDGLAATILARLQVDRADVEADLVRGAPFDAEGLATLGIDLDEVRRQAEETFGPGALDRTRAARGRWRGGTSRSSATPRRRWSWRCARPSPRARLHRHRAPAARAAARRPGPRRARRAGGRARRHPGAGRGVGAQAPSRIGQDPSGAHRRRDDLPGLPGAPARGAARPGDRDRARRARRARPAAWTHDVHQAVDDAPYGGGPGMVMRPQVWGEALDAVLAAGPPAQAGGADARRAAVHAGHRAGVGHGRAAGVRLRPLRGDRPARDRSTPRRSRRSASATTCWSAARSRCS